VIGHADPGRFQAGPIDVSAFLDTWLPDLEKDGILCGLNCSAPRAMGYELPRWSARDSRWRRDDSCTIVGMRALGAVIAIVAACGGDDAADDHMVGDDVQDDAPDDAPDDLVDDDDAPPLPNIHLFVTPEVHESFVVEAILEYDPIPVSFFVNDETEPRCSPEPPYLCLIHLAPDGPAGPVTITARATGIEDTVVTTTRVVPTLEACADPVATCVTTWTTAGNAAGYAGLTYENRDGEHAVIPHADMPDLAYVTHNDGNSTWGQTGVSADPNAIVLANQSQAYTTVGFSLLRYDVVNQLAFNRLETLSTQSKWRLYPEHTDCGVEDMFAFMTPIWLTSQGSSGSELDEGRRLLEALAALPAPVRTMLHTEGALVSVMSAVHRRARVASDVEYLTGAAHPTAFGNLDVERATVDLAHSLTTTHVPPVASVTVTADEFAPADQLVTGTSTVARVFSAGGAEMRAITVDASASKALNGQPLTYHWRVLRGDPSLVRLWQRDTTDPIGTIEFMRHPEGTYESLGSASGTLITHKSSLVVVGLFVHNGHFFSTPAFISSYSADPRRGAPGDNNLD
jgi:hypothetical protein